MWLPSIVVLLVAAPGSLALDPTIYPGQPPSHDLSHSQIATPPILASANGPTHAKVHPRSFPTRIQHVIQIFLENQGLSNVLAKGPYEKSLYDNYSGASNFYSVCHPSAPNYLAVTSGTALQCGSDGLSSYGDQNVANLTSASGLSWDGYFESMPSACNTSTTTLYVPHHNPFLYYTDLASECIQRDLAISNLTRDFPFSSAPANYTWISPNMTDDGHNTGVAFADQWLSQFLPKVISASWYSSTAVFIEYDESCDGGTGCSGTSDTSSYPALENASACTSSPAGCGGHVYLAVVSPYTKGQGLYTSNATEWNVLCTQEWLLGLPATGNQDCTGSFAAMKSMFNFSSPPPSDYPVTFSESGLNGGTPWNVTLNGTSNSSSGRSIGFTEPNGSYPYSITPVPGYLAYPSGGSLTVNGTAAGLNITFIAKQNETYPVIFNETGLPIGTNWSVSLGNVSESSTGPSFSFSEPNGTYRYSLGTVPGWTTSRSTGSIQVAGEALVAAFGWVQVEYLVNFNETGLVASAEWWINVSGGPTIDSSSGSLSFFEPNGSYDFTVRASDGNYTSPSGTFAVKGGPVFETVLFFREMFALTFSETGLPSGTDWSVSIYNQSWTGAAPSNVTATGLSNGSYTFLVGPIRGFNATPAVGSVVVAGPPGPVRILFAPTSRPAPNGTAPQTFFGLTANGELAVLGGIAAAAIIGAAVLVLRSRRRKTLRTSVRAHP
jgi:hypothetical protein